MGLDNWHLRYFLGKTDSQCYHHCGFKLSNNGTEEVEIEGKETGYEENDKDEREPHFLR